MLLNDLAILICEALILFLEYSEHGVLLLFHICFFFFQIFYLFLQLINVLFLQSIFLDEVLVLFSVLLKLRNLRSLYLIARHIWILKIHLLVTLQHLIKLTHHWVQIMSYAWIIVLIWDVIAFLVIEWAAIGTKAQFIKVEATSTRTSANYANGWRLEVVVVWSCLINQVKLGLLSCIEIWLCFCTIAPKRYTSHTVHI